MKVLITGSSGNIGSKMVGLLEGGFELAGVDRVPPRAGAELPATVADVHDVDDLRGVVAGHDAVVHLAGNPDVDTPWPDVLRNNITLTRNVYEACRLEGVRRVVFASSNHAAGLFEDDEPYLRIRAGDYRGLEPGGFKRVDHTVPIRPDSDYGASKAFGEALGRLYSEHFGLQVACLRIGSFTEENDPTANIRMRATWCSHRDLAQLIRLCLKAPDLQFDIFYGVSANTWRFWDTSHAESVLGYRSADNAEEHYQG